MKRVILILALSCTGISYAEKPDILGVWVSEGGEILLKENGLCEETYYYLSSLPPASCRYDFDGQKLLVIEGDSRNEGEVEIHLTFELREDGFYIGDSRRLTRQKTNKLKNENAASGTDAQRDARPF